MQKVAEKRILGYALPTACWGKARHAIKQNRLKSAKTGRWWTRFLRTGREISTLAHQKPMEYLYDLLVSAFTKFQAAGLSLDRARLGLHCWWVVKGSDQPVPRSESQLDRALACEEAWAQHCDQLQNPYSDLVVFYKTGASLGRWENHILDVFGPSGEKLWGVPLKSLVNAANATLKKTE